MISIRWLGHVLPKDSFAFRLKLFLSLFLCRAKKKHRAASHRNKAPSARLCPAQQQKEKESEEASFVFSCRCQQKDKSTFDSVCLPKHKQRQIVLEGEKSLFHNRLVVFSKKKEQKPKR